MNLTKTEKDGLFSIRKRMKEGEIVVVKTDKSSKLVLMKREDYLKIGETDCKEDKLLSRTYVKRIQKKMNEHVRMLSKSFNIGENHKHLTRISKSKLNKSENTAPKYFLYKDHKKEKLQFRPVVSGCSSDTIGMSNLLSDIVESM